MSRVFLSHSSADKPLVKRVAQEIKNGGLKAWLDEAEILPGESLIKKIGDALEESKFIAAFLSDRSIESNWVQKELSIATTREIEGRTLAVIPIRLDDCRFPSFLADKYYVDLRDETRWKREIGKFLAALRAPFWIVGSMTYYDAMEIAEQTEFWRLPTLEEAKRLRHKMRSAKLEAIALWTSTWKDQELSYVVGYEKGETVECCGIDHFGSVNCVLVPS